ncbi:galactose oxidase [Aureobasidium pullulans]|uniref:Galactose oxidase n=1 Tax=Aureobasidium pullulans TaxID=5580 RepID=A0A4S9Y7C6_AURPU|nr:galactose oxidase [Aureobasidium pullulans]THZ86884.1 galactose oxidase [Aureobasidium pullulans]
MAEIAAGAVVAEQVVSTTLEGSAIAGYAVAKPTVPLKATFSQIATADKDDAALALARSHHTVSIANDKACIFGGQTTDGKLASNDIHTVTLPLKQTHETDIAYACYPAVPRDEGAAVPSARTRHAACVQGHELAVFGGCDEKHAPVDQDSSLWIWNIESSKWHQVSSEGPKPRPRFDHKLFHYGGHILLHGGRSSVETELNDTWFFDMIAHTWTQLPDSPKHSESVAFADGTLYMITNSPAEGITHVYRLEIGDSVPAPGSAHGLQWQRITNSAEVPSSAGPGARTGGSLIPVTTGYGRLYLVYFFGSREVHVDAESPGKSVESSEAPRPFESDLWTYQLPSKSTKPTSWTDFKPAAIKDTIRDKLGYKSGGYEWAEIEVQATEQSGHEGKVHPGPRGFFAADVASDGRSVVMWGGDNARGEKEADGWLIRFE